MVIGTPAGRAQSIELLRRHGCEVAEADNPYEAMVQLVLQPHRWRAMVIGLAGVYPEELAIIRSVKGRFPDIAVWLAQADGRGSAVAEARRFGADAVLDEQGLHVLEAPESAAPAARQRIAPEPVVPPQPPRLPPVLEPQSQGSGGQGTGPVLKIDDDGRSNGNGGHLAAEAVLSPEELRALLQDQPLRPAAGPRSAS